jgi:MFS family permease
MNRLKKHKWLAAISVCVATILSGITIAVLSLKLGFPTAWAKSGFLISFAGAGGIGVVIALYVHSIPHQDKYHRKRLEVKAWKDLGMYFYSLIVGGVSFYYLITHFDEMSILSTPPAKTIMLSVTIVIGIWVAVGPFIMKKRLLEGLDERERLIYEKAKMISDSIFGGLSMAGFIGIFAWFGPKAPIPVFVPVLLFFVLAFVAEIVKPLMILIQYKTERSSE